MRGHGLDIWVAYRYTRDKLAPGAYHVYNRARDGLRLFRDDADRRQFEYLIDRHISEVVRFDDRGKPYAWLRDEVRMNARNLMYTHFHLILWQRVPGGLDRLMSRVLSSYSRYYHRRYGTDGPLYEGEYRARRIESPAQFRWRVSYVVANHQRLGVDWPFSSHGQLIEPEGASSALDARATLKLFGGTNGYLEYMRKRGRRQALDAELRFEDALH